MHTDEGRGTGIFSGDHFTPDPPEPYHFRARIGTFQRVAAPFPGGASGRARPGRRRSPDRRPASPDRSSPPSRRRTSRSIGCESRWAEWRWQNRTNGALLQGCSVRTNIEQLCRLGNKLSVRNCRRSPRPRAGRPVLCAVPDAFLARREPPCPESFRSAPNDGASFSRGRATCRL
jgi:hypothetical protein